MRPRFDFAVVVVRGGKQLLRYRVRVRLRLG